MNTKSIAFKLVVGGCLAVVVPLIIVAVLALPKVTEALLKAGHANIEVQTSALATTIQTTIELQSRMASAFASGYKVVEVGQKIKKSGIDAVSEDIAVLRQEMKKQYKESLDDSYLGIFVTDETGLLYTGELLNGNEYKGSNVASRDYFQEAKNTKKAVVGEIVKSKSTGEMIYVVAAPVLSNSGEFLGIFGVSIKGDALVKLISGTKIGKTGYAFMSDKSGIINAHPNAEFILTLDLKTLQGMEDITAAMLAGKKGVEDYEVKGVHHIAGFAPVPLKGWSVTLTQDEEEFLQEPHTIRNSIILIAVISLLIVGVLIFFASKQITRPLRNAAAGLKDIAEGEGDLTMRLSVDSKDEIGEMAIWFNVFIEKLQKIVGKIADNSNNVGKSSNQLSSIAKELSSGAENTSQRAANVATASEEMSANLNNVAAAMEQSATNTNMVASAAEEMSSTINEIAENAEKARRISGDAVNQAQSASEKMIELGKAAQKISAVTETITEISEQTNLLALNATIEAARAGEAGKGFAVVANEIKELAKQTAQATLNIKEQISDVQNTTKATGTEINQISSVIRGVNEIVATIAAAVEEQTAATREIANNIAQASQGIQEVNENVSQSSVVSGNITEDISKVNMAANGISESSKQVQASSEDLQRMAAELNTIVGSFRI
jgi:methyl-accepting chemotaxis protein